MTMDMEVIKRIKRVKRISHNFRELSPDKIVGSTNGYLVDAEGKVIGLNLWDTGSIDISSLEELPDLETLYLGYNQLSDISPLKSLTKLTTLYLHENRIFDISPLRSLSNLRTLYLSDNQISDISPLAALNKLSILDLSSNLISDISFLATGISLTILDLSDNKISGVSALKSLSNLRELYLRANRISDIASLESLEKLHRLDLRFNLLTHLPGNIGQWHPDTKWKYDSAGEGIFLQGNPLESPPVEIVTKGRAEVNAWFHELTGGAQKALNEVKILLVGDGGAGKTSLMKHILNRNFNDREPQTYGINIEDWDIEAGNEKIKVNIWDFGGQRIMHTAHQFFFSKRSLYILVLDGRKDAEPDYWLKHIRSFGGDSPILVVLNKIDQNPGYEQNRKSLMERHENIKGFYRTSCKKMDGVPQFIEALKCQITSLKHLQITWPKSWFRVKQKLEGMKDIMEKDYISYERYLDLCREESIVKEENQRALIGFLHDLGVVLHFDRPGLRETGVINPLWATCAVYQIINSPTLAQNSGLLSMNEFRRILDSCRYPYPKELYIIELMKRFELCFSIDSDTILVPDLLDVTEPPFRFKYEGSFAYFMEFDFLPKSVISRFIVRSYREIKGNLMWRTGVMLESPLFECNAVVKVDEKKKCISVHAAGGQPRDYFQTIRKTLHHIFRSFEDLEVREMIPCNCRECAVTSHPRYFEYSDLQNALKKGRTDIQCQNSFDNVLIERLLNGIELPTDRDNYLFDVFISYSSADRQIVDDIIDKLKRYDIQYWLDDEQITSGTEVIPAIEKGLETSRFILACFSRQQLKSGWCRMESQSVLGGIFSNQTHQRVLPLILDDLPESQLPPSIRILRCERYGNANGLQRILQLIKKTAGAS